MPEDDSEDPTLTAVATLRNEQEAAMLTGQLRSAGIEAVVLRRGPVFGGVRPTKVYVRNEDLDGAREVMNAKPIDEDALVAAEEAAATVLTTPKHGDSVEIPVPGKGDATSE
jgi:hypothetical protein